MLSLSTETIRIFIHVLAATVWVGGQIVMSGLVPRLRKLGPDATKAAANGFAAVAWPAFLVAFATGMWSMMAINNPSGAWSATLGIKILLVLAAAGAAVAHARSANRAVKAATGALGLVLALVILLFGVMLTLNTPTAAALP